MDDIAIRLGHLTDKFVLGYYPHYKRLAEHIGKKGKVLEIGVQEGGSLAMWKELFPEGLVVGADINPSSMFPGGTERIIISQDDPALADRAREISPDGYDLIVDDASHIGELSEKTFRILFPLVKPGGWYVLEDWAVGYLPGYRDTYGPSMLRLAESFLPMLGLEPHNPGITRPVWALDGGANPASEIDVVEYRFSQAFVHKRSSQ